MFADASCEEARPVALKLNTAAQFSYSAGDTRVDLIPHTGAGAMDGRMVLIELPPGLPLMMSRAAAAASGVKREPDEPASDSGEKGGRPAAAAAGHCLADLCGAAGCKLEVLKSGRCRLRLGDVLLPLEALATAATEGVELPRGAQPAARQELVSLDVPAESVEAEEAGAEWGVLRQLGPIAARAAATVGVHELVGRLPYETGHAGGSDNNADGSGAGGA